MLIHNFTQHNLQFCNLMLVDHLFFLQ